jgi:hypothetical protein
MYTKAARVRAERDFVAVCVDVDDGDMGRGEFEELRDLVCERGPCGALGKGVSAGGARR